MSEKDVMSDKEVLNVIIECKQINNNKLDSLLYRLCHAGDNKDTLQYYRHITYDAYTHKICQILNYICQKIDYSVEVIECKYITDNDIRNRVGILPAFALIDFIEAAEFNFFIVVDYEAPDKVYKCDYLLDVLEDTCIKRIVNKELNQDDIDDVVRFINDLDLFDIVLYEEYNGVKYEN